MRLFVAVLMAAVFSSGCSQESSSESATFSSFDDCILGTVSRAPNSEAVAQLRSACVRKFSVEMSDELKFAGGENDNEVLVVNTTPHLVTMFEVDAGAQGKWDYRLEIEPGNWTEIENPIAPGKLVDAIKEKSVSVKAIRGIPVGAVNE